jgi:hypothetical protein
MSCGGGHLGLAIGIKKQKLAWMVLYKVSVFRSSRIFNMAARGNNMLRLAEISKVFFSETNELTEKFTDDGRQVISIVHLDLGPGELKTFVDTEVVAIIITRS